MKKLFSTCVFALALSLLIGQSVYADGEDWKTMPVITHIYELAKEKVFLEWEGNADLYRINIDGKDVSTVKLKNANINLKPGTHNIVIIPLKYESRNADTRVDLNIDASVGGQGVGGGGSIDLAALGIDPKDIKQGTQSKPFKMKYSVDPVMNAVPEVTGAYTDFDNRVVLSFVDKFDSDVYRIFIKSGKDVIETEFDTSSKEAAALISKQNTSVTITLDQKYLKSHGWMIPDLGSKYGFAVKLGKWPKNYVDNKKEPPTVIESKDSKYFDYTPYAAWKNTPTITYASQTADGQITLKWDHDDNGLGCEYKIIRPDKLLVVKKGATEVGKTSGKEYTVKDLGNGKYSFAVIPVLGKEEGYSSEDQTIKVENNWMIAPSLEYRDKGNKQLLLKWDAPQDVDNYHITVSVGSGSLLRFVNLDFKKYKEFDVPAKAGKMEYTFTYDQNIDSPEGVKLMFEIYATRKTAKGAEQKSATSKQLVLLK